MAFGVGVPLPTRLTFAELPQNILPKSEAFANQASIPAGGHDINFIGSVVERWRGSTVSQKANVDEAQRPPVIPDAAPVQPSPPTQPSQPTGFKGLGLLKKPAANQADPYAALRKRHIDRRSDRQSQRRHSSRSDPRALSRSGEPRWSGRSRTAAAGRPSKLMRKVPRRILQEERLGEVVALRIADAGGGLQIGQLLEGLDTLGDDGHAQRMAERFDRPQDALAARPLVNGRDERPVDLDLIGGDIRQRAQRRVAGSEVVDGNANADLAQHGEHQRLELVLGDERVLGQLQHDAVGAFAPLQLVDDGAHEGQIARLFCGDVDADGRVPVRTDLSRCSIEFNASASTKCVMGSITPSSIARPTKELGG